MTLRALDILASADVVACEDTRVTAKLLARYGIAARPSALHAHNEAQRAGGLVAHLAAGRSVALVSDAGTPAISDPGARLVRAAHEAGRPVVAVPGSSAVAAAVSVAGLRAESFLFAGFLPAQAKARRERLARLARVDAAVVLYEAPHRVRATLADMAEAFDGLRPLVVARELTKAFECVARMPLADAEAWVAGDANRSRGEFVLIVDVADEAPREAVVLDETAERWLAALLAELPPARAARVVAAVTGVARDVVYARAMAIKPA